MKTLESKETKRLLVDIKHPAQLNLFKGLSGELQQEDWDVTISYLQRGKLPKIIEYEYSGFKTVPIGSSKGSRWSIFWEGNVKRTLTFLYLIWKHKFNICIAASSIPLALACRIMRVPIIQFYDDPERKSVNRLNAFFSTRLFFPPIVAGSSKISIFNCLKEWSYLSPKRFHPAPVALEKYGLCPHEYVFVREVSNKSFNYFHQADAIVGSFAHEILPHTKVVLSLEDKSLAGQYPKHWLILDEPVEDIHSLIYFSRLVISSGDSMAREGAMLGVPSIYCGVRKMKANEMLTELGVLKHLPGREAVALINENIEKPFDAEGQLKMREKLVEDWDDMVVFMKSQIEKYKLTYKTI